MRGINTRTALPIAKIPDIAIARYPRGSAGIESGGQGNFAIPVVAAGKFCLSATLDADIFINCYRRAPVGPSSGSSADVVSTGGKKAISRWVDPRKCPDDGPGSRITHFPVYL